MIFVDQTGRRWRRIKRSTLALTLLASTPVIALVGGSLVYHPHWGLLPLVKQTGAVLSQLNLSASQPAVAPTPTQPAKSIITANTRATSSAQASVSPSPASSTTNAPAASETPSVTPAPAPADAATVDPGNSFYGRGHQPIK